MATDGKIRVGIVGASASRGFASIAHIPALRGLPQFEITAVCTTRQETAEAAARQYGAPLAFSDPADLAQHPEIDLVTVSVKVPDHYRPVLAAIQAGKQFIANGRLAVTPMKPLTCSMPPNEAASFMWWVCRVRCPPPSITRRT